MKDYVLVKYASDIVLLRNIDADEAYGIVVLCRGNFIKNEFNITEGKRLYFSKSKIIKESDSIDELTEEFLLEIL